MHPRMAFLDRSQQALFRVLCIEFFGSPKQEILLVNGLPLMSKEQCFGTVNDALALLCASPP